MRWLLKGLGVAILATGIAVGLSLIILAEEGWRSLLDEIKLTWRTRNDPDPWLD